MASNKQIMSSVGVLTISSRSYRATGWSSPLRVLGRAENLCVVKLPSKRAKWQVDED